MTTRSGAGRSRARRNGLPAERANADGQVEEEAEERKQRDEGQERVHSTPVRPGGSYEMPRNAVKPTRSALSSPVRIAVADSTLQEIHDVGKQRQECLQAVPDAARAAGEGDPGARPPAGGRGAPPP